MNAEQARERAKKLKIFKCSDPKHHLMNHPKNTCVECLTAALLEAYKEGRDGEGPTNGSNTRNFKSRLWQGGSGPGPGHPGAEGGVMDRYVIRCIDCLMFGIPIPPDTQCSNCHSRVTETWIDPEVVESLRRELAIMQRLYKLRGEALFHPCLNCGYEPNKITLADGSIVEKE